MEPDLSKISPFESANSVLFLGGVKFSPSESGAVFGMVTGVRSFVPGLERGLEIRRLLLRAPRMQTQLEGFIDGLRRGSASGDGTFGVGWIFRDQQGWGLGYYFEECSFVRAYEDMSGSLPVVEDVMILSYERKVEITDLLQSKIVMALG